MDNPEEIEHTINNVNYILFTKTKTAKVVQSKEASGNITLKTYIDHDSGKYLVTEIGDKAFRSSGICSLKFEPDSQVKRFGSLLFQNSKISELFIPDSLEEFSQDWCNGTDLLTEITINNNPYYKYENGFLINKRNKEIIFASRDLPGHLIIPSYIKKIGHSAFHLCNQITSIKIESSEIELIDTFAFCQCGKLIKFIITKLSKDDSKSSDETTINSKSSDETTINSKSSDETTINSKSSDDTETSDKSTSLDVAPKRIILGENCLAFSDSLKNLIVTCDELVLSENCLQCCTSLTSLSFKMPKIIIGRMCFFGCEKLDIISISDGEMLKIDEQSFLNLSNLKSIFFNSKQLSIKDSSFESCSSVAKIYLKTESDLNSNVLKYFKKVQDIDLTSSSNLTVTKSSLENVNTLISARFRSNNLSLEEGCFKGHANLSSIDIECSNSITFKADDFENCKSLKSIKFVKSAMFNYSEKVELADNSFVFAENLEEVEIMANSIVLGKSCFCGLKKLKKVHLHGKYISVSDDCFKDCNQISSFLITKIAGEKIIEKVELADNSFLNSENIKEIELLANKIELGRSCFSGSKSVQNVLLQGKEIKISENCFENCTSLNRIDVTKSVEIGCTEKIELLDNSFLNTGNLEEVEMTANSIEIGKCCFNGSKNLKKIQLRGKNVTFLDDCFKDCRLINSLIITKTDDIEFAENIKFSDNSFLNAMSLEEVDIAANTIELGKSCFSGAKNLQKVLLNGKNVTILDECFKGCILINSFIISKSEDIGFAEKIELPDNSFCNSKKLKEVEITANTIKLGKSCFSGAENLQKVLLSGKNVTILDECFKNCTLLDSFTISKLEDNKTIEKIELSEDSFYYTKSLKKVDLEAQKIIVGKSCFNWAENITEVCLKAGNVFVSDQCFNNCSALTSFTICNSHVTSIGSKQFVKCSKLTSISISVINYNAKILNQEKLVLANDSFEGAKKLKDFEIIGGNITISNELLYCKNLSKLVIKGGEKVEILSGMFNSCKNLERVEINSMSLTINEKCFNNNSKLKTVELDCSEIDIQASCFNHNQELTSLLFIDVRQIYLDSNDFCNLNSLTNIDILSYTYLIIGQSCFTNLNSLQKIDFYSNEITIGSESFSNCESLTLVNLNKTVSPNSREPTNIAVTFSPYIKRIPIDSLFIGENSFKACNSLTTLNIQVKKEIIIGKSSFNNLKNLKNIAINKPPRLEIDKDCFVGCPGWKQQGTALIIQPSASINLVDFNVHESIEMRKSFHINSLDKNFENTRKFDSFYVLGIDRYSRKQSFVSMFPSKPVTFTNLDARLILEHCYPQGIKRIPKSIHKNKNILTGFTFFQYMKVKVNDESDELVEKCYIGVCLYIRIPISANSFVGDQYDREYPFCLCLLTNNPDIASHFTFLTDLVDPIINSTASVKNDDLIIPDKLKIKMNCPLKFLNCEQHCEFIAKSPSSKSMSFLLPKLLEYYNSSTLLIYDQYLYFLFPTLQTLLTFVNPKEIVILFFCMLCEIQITFISEDMNKSSFCSLALANLSEFGYLKIFPYLPSILKDVFDSPIKSIIGYHDKNREYEILVNLDENKTFYNTDLIRLIHGFPFTSILQNRVDSFFRKNEKKFLIPSNRESTKFIEKADKNIFPNCFKHFYNNKYILSQEFVKDLVKLLNEPFFPSLREFTRTFLVTDATDPNNLVTVFNKSMFKMYIQEKYRPFMNHFMNTTAFDQLELGLEEELSKTKSPRKLKKNKNQSKFHQNRSYISTVIKNSSKRRAKSWSKSRK